MDNRKELGATFDTEASKYDKMRPGYADELFQAIFEYVKIGEGSRVVEVGSGTGLELREDFISATDISQEDITHAQYLAALQERGNQQLEANKFVKCFEFEADPDINFTYGVDYDLGDIVTVKKKSWDLTEDMRITEIQEIYENGAMVISPTLGNPLPETIDWEDK